MSGFEVKDGGHPKPPPPGCRKQKKKQRCQTNIETFNIEVQHTGILQGLFPGPCKIFVIFSLPN